MADGVQHTDTAFRARALTGWLERAPGPLFVAYAIAAAFSTYFCMYAFRKPFASAKFDGFYFLDSKIELKTAIVISQIIGYAISKYIGIKICSEITAARRAVAMIALILFAECALVVYGVAPNHWKVVAIFFNGLPLGMVWGLVVGYLEGRRTSEVLLVGLSCSYIVSSGIVKDVGRALMEGTAAEWWTHVPGSGAQIGALLGNVSEAWMPAVTGLHFLPLFLLSVWLLDQLPRPNVGDVEARVGRAPMNRAGRMAFIRQFMFGLGALCVAYFFLTAYRDFRDNYQVEMFDGLGYRYADNQAVISKTELLVTAGVMAALALINLVKDNRRGLLTVFVLMAGGALTLGVSTLLLDAQMINGFWWMTLIGLGSYLAYVPYGAILFDRLIASTRVTATAVFAIYLADAIGYTGSVGVQLYKDLFQSEMSRLAFFKGFTYFMSALGVACLAAGAVYFLRRSDASERTTQPDVLPSPAESQS